MLFHDRLVTAYRLNSSGKWELGGHDLTDSAGYYEILGLVAGTYRINFNPYDGLHASEYYNDKPDAASANNLVIPAGAVIADLNASLEYILPKPVYRFWSPRYRGHFFTISEAEKNHIATNLTTDWTYEGIAYYAFTEQLEGTVTLYRFWSSRYRGHFFTISVEEAENIIAKFSRDWRYEGIAYYVYPNQSAINSPVYRFWSSRYKHHFFTISAAEKDNIINKLSHDWAYEGMPFYVLGYPVTPSSYSVPASSMPAPKVTDEHAIQAAAASGDTSFADDAWDVAFPLSYDDGNNATAYVYKLVDGEWQCLHSATKPAPLLEVAGIEPGCGYRLEVWVEYPDSGGGVLDHSSRFERSLDAPESLDGDKAVALDPSGRAGAPVERVRMPEGDGALTVKLYSASKGVVQTLENVSGGETVNLPIGEWNSWHWVGAWRDADGKLVFSMWLRHKLEE